MFRIPEPVKIAKITFDKRAYYPGDTATATVTLTAGDPAHPVALSAQFVTLWIASCSASKAGKWRT